jgi:hypothetical protein
VSACAVGCSDLRFFHISENVCLPLSFLGHKGSENVFKKFSSVVSFKFFWTFSKICNFSEIFRTYFQVIYKQIFLKFSGGKCGAKSTTQLTSYRLYLRPSHFSSQKSPRTCFCNGTKNQSTPALQSGTFNGGEGVKTIYQASNLPHIAVANLFSTGE